MIARITITVTIEDTSDEAKRYDARHKYGPRAPTIKCQHIAQSVERQLAMVKAYFVNETRVAVDSTLPTTVDVRDSDQVV